jgi:hypothetical protein
MRRKYDWGRIPGEVRFHAGHRGLEVPKEVILRSRVFPITSIVFRERVEGGAAGGRHEVFRCRIGLRTIEIWVGEDGTTEIYGEKSGKGENGT